MYSIEVWDRPSLNNVDFARLSVEIVLWLERDFEEEEVSFAVFDLGGDKAPRPNRFPIAFFQRFWDITKVDILDFMQEFHQRGKLTKNIVPPSLPSSQRRLVLSVSMISD